MEGEREEGRERIVINKENRKESNGERDWVVGGRCMSEEEGRRSLNQMCSPLLSFGCVSTDREDQSILCT